MKLCLKCKKKTLYLKPLNVLFLYPIIRLNMLEVWQHKAESHLYAYKQVTVYLINKLSSVCRICPPLATMLYA